MFAEFVGEVMELAAREGLAVRRLPTGVSIPFADGCDEMLVLERDAEWGRLVAEAGPRAAAASALAEFRRLDAARAGVTLALRHLVHEAGWAIDMASTGQWGYGSSGFTGGFSVGAGLTMRLRHEDAVTALRTIITQQTLIPCPDQIRLEQLVRLTEPPEGERTYDAREGDPPPDPETDPLCDRLRDVVEAKALEIGGHEALDEIAKELASPRPKRYKDGGGISDGDWREVLKAFRKLAAPREVFREILRNSDEIGFADGHDDYVLRRWDKNVVEAFAGTSAASVARQLFDEFAALDRGRTRVLRALLVYLEESGLAVDRSQHDPWYFGRETREGSFPVGRDLTVTLKKRTPAEALARWITEKMGRERPDDATLARLLEHKGPIAPDRPLPATPPGKGPRLPDLATLDWSEIDAEAARVIASFLGRVPPDHEAFGKWDDPQWYRRSGAGAGGDAWVDEAWWVEAARTATRSGRASWVAAVILLAAGSDEPRAELLEVMKQADEFGGPLDELISYDALWYFYPDHPLARQVFDGDEAPIEVLLRHDDPRAHRRVAAEVKEDLARYRPGDERVAPGRAADAVPPPRHGRGGREEHAGARCAIESLAKLTAAAAATWLSAAELAKIRGFCLEVAAGVRTDLEYDHVALVRCAGARGWPEVCDALAANPEYEHVLLAGEMASYGVTEAALAWSIARPGPFAARLAVRAMLGRTLEMTLRQHDLAGEFTLPKLFAGQQGAIREAMAEGVTREWNDERLAGAIAWVRCRAAGVAL